MINSYAVDVEIFPNVFSITFVDLKDYLSKFSDCVDDKENPKALTECLSVSEIKKRLDEVSSKVFYISDTDDSQLLEMVAFINNMQSRYETKTVEDGNVIQTPIRTDLYGFNNQSYDDMMIRAFLMYFNRFDDAKQLIKFLYKFSKKLIDLQNDKEALYNDKEIELVRQYRLPYATVDVQKVYALHSVGVNVDKSTGERVKFGKSLKQTSINLKWHELLDFKLPPIDEEEKEYYWNKPELRGISCLQLNKLITNDFDRYILPKYIEPMLTYNKNDVFIVCEIVRQKPDETRLRYSISNAFKVPVLSSSRANIADKLVTKFYSDMSGLNKKQFEKLRTERTRLSFSKIIFPHIQFKTKELQDFLNRIKKVSIYRTSKSEFEENITFYGTTYTIATGGIHSQDTPKVYKSDDTWIYMHHDYSSYYPSIMISYEIYPEHLNKAIFVKLVRYLRDTRIKCKHNVEAEVVHGVPNKIAAEALKIVINAIYGKFGSERFWLYDRFAQMQVTINGQLMTMTLIEELELNGIHVISANTDGIVIKLKRTDFKLYEEITQRWNETNKMSADYEIYDKLIVRDINNYIALRDNGKIDYKGALDPKQYIKDLSKGYDMPIVAKAVAEYFLNDTPVMETLRNHKDILDFCKTQNVGKQFDVVYDKVVDGQITSVYSQRHVRFYVSYDGVVIQKENKTTNKRERLASGKPVIILNSLDDVPIENRKINYNYYYEEAYKLIDPIMLTISSNQKGNAAHGTLSGKSLIKKYSRQYSTLFDDSDLD